MDLLKQARTVVALYEDGDVLNDSLNIEEYIHRRGSYLCRRLGDPKSSSAIFSMARMQAGEIFSGDTNELSVQQIRTREEGTETFPLLPFPTKGRTETLNDYADYGDKEWTPTDPTPRQRASLADTKQPLEDDETDDEETPKRSIYAPPTGIDAMFQVRKITSSKDHKSSGDPNTKLDRKSEQKLAEQTSENISSPVTSTATMPQLHPTTSSEDCTSSKDLDAKPHQTSEPKLASPPASPVLQVQELSSARDDSFAQTVKSTPSAQVPQTSAPADAASSSPAATTADQTVGDSESVVGLSTASTNTATPAPSTPITEVSPVAAEATKSAPKAGDQHLTTHPGVSSYANRPTNQPVKTQGPKKPKAKASSPSPNPISSPHTVLKGTKRSHPGDDNADNDHQSAATSPATSLPPAKKLKGVATKVVKQKAEKRPKAAEKKKAQQQQQQQQPEPVGHADDIVRCVCGATHDDGTLMLNCDQCGVWQHVACMGAAVPADIVAGGDAEGEVEYLCHLCDPDAHEEVVAKFKKGKGVGAGRR